jgi:hypothetical protein
MKVDIGFTLEPEQIRAIVERNRSVRFIVPARTRQRRNVEC